MAVECRILWPCNKDSKDPTETSLSFLRESDILTSLFKIRTKSYIETKDDIRWYYEQEGSGPHVVLIPDGIGDCQEFDKALPMIAEHGFTVTTFDNPGMSRSSECPADAYQNVTAPKLADQVLGLLDALHIDIATVWGSSSGGATVLALSSMYPSRVRNALPHEVPIGEQKFFEALLQESDEVISEKVAAGFASQFPNDIESWEAMGKEFHDRLWKNYPRWARGYGVTLTPSVSLEKEALTRTPMDWTIGFSTPTGMFLENIVGAVKAGLTVRLLPGTHFPYISDPVAFSKYVVEMAKKYL